MFKYIPKMPHCAITFGFYGFVDFVVFLLYTDLMNKRPWTSEELKFIADNYQLFGIDFVAEKLNRTAGSVSNKAGELGLTKTIKSPNPVKIGEIFGRLTVVSFSHVIKSHKQFNCKCSCGNSCIVDGSHLRQGYTSSCGCFSIESHRLDPGVASWNVLFRQYKYAAKKRGIEFLLTIEEFIEIASLNCEYCGEPPRPFNPYVKRDGSEFSSLSGEGAFKISADAVDRSWIEQNGVDRKDNDLGYRKENSVACCEMCNKFKWNYSVKDFLLHCFKIVKFQLTRSITWLYKN